MRWIGLLATLVVLDAALTFVNLWPTPAISWQGGISVELAIAILALCAVARKDSAPSKTTMRVLAGLWTALAIGRYADVTVAALYGRPINLYWDLRFIPDVVAMVTRVAALAVIVACVVGIAIALALIYLLMRRSFGRVGTAMLRRDERWTVAAVAVAVIVVFGVDCLRGRNPGTSIFPDPVMATYGRQLRLMTLAAEVHLPASPPMSSDLSRVKGGDVYVVFVESYGAVSFDRQDVSDRLIPSRRALETAISDTHRGVVSAYVESPTFGGSSWLAHLSLLSGIEVRDPETNAKLMTEHRDTVVRAFGRHGFRTIALMPGMRTRWPEGAFYGYDEIYGAERLAYGGPPFGWFAIPDQFSLERLDALEASRPSRPPLFVVFPTVSTHFPFSPTPPYQGDWARMLSDQPYDNVALANAYLRVPDWTDFAPGYVESMAYDFATIGGYLRAHAGGDIVMILLGDHQPAAAVSGVDASWDVPVHVIANRQELLDRFTARGFVRGLTPVRPHLGPMNTLASTLLDIFGS